MVHFLRCHTRNFIKLFLLWKYNNISHNYLASYISRISATVEHAYNQQVSTHNPHRQQQNDESLDDIPEGQIWQEISTNEPRMRTGTVPERWSRQPGRLRVEHGTGHGWSRHRSTTIWKKLLLTSSFCGLILLYSIRFAFSSLHRSKCGLFVRLRSLSQCVNWTNVRYHSCASMFGFDAFGNFLVLSYAFCLCSL